MRALIHISSGRGPVEVREFVRMLGDYFIRESQVHGIGCRWYVEPPATGQCRSACIEVEWITPSFPAWLVALNGTHVLVARGTTRSRHSRKRWFVAVEVREVSSANPSDLLLKDVHMESLRASGPGGQHVNKTNSAVRVTHLPTGVSVLSRNERSATRNRKRALELLQQRLQDRAADQLSQQRRRDHVSAQQVERGNAVRTYVLNAAGVMELV